MSDYGLATLTSVKHKGNSREHMCGTICWWPPEQHAQGTLDRRWRKPLLHPNGNREHPWDQRHMVWQIGCIIHDMMTLGEHNMRVHNWLRDFEQRRDAEEVLREYNYSIFSGREQSIPDSYSARLIRLVDKCLNVLPQNRPFPDEVIKTCEDALTDIGRHFEKKGMAKPPVFYGKDAAYDMKDHVRRMRR
jgi:hypothetical protein